MKTLSKVVLSLLVVGTFMGGLAGAAEEKEKFGRLTPQEVQAKLGKPNVFVFDNNTQEIFAEGHVPNAKWVKPSEIKATDLPQDKTATLIFYCANEHCSACHDGAGKALSLGYKNVFIMPAGIQGWKKAALPVQKA